MKTPIYNHIFKYPSVYEPYEDTFLLIDALEQELPFIKSINPKIIAEIGSGSGVNITSLCKALGQSSVYLATDINSEACLATQETAKANDATVEIYNMNFLDHFRENIFDLIIFNPPYVVTDSQDISGRGIERSWAGGNKGREVMDKLFPKLPNLLSKNGAVYLVVIKENKPDEIMEMVQNLGFRAEMVAQRRILGEQLYVLKFQKCNKYIK